MLLFGLDDHAAARAALTEALPALEASHDLYLRAHGLTTLGLIDLADGNFTAARSHLEDGLMLARTIDDRRSIAVLAACTADAARCQGHYMCAAALYNESLALHKQLGNTTEIPALVHNLGYVALGQGDGLGARALFGESLHLQHALGNRAGVAEGLTGLGALALESGQPERAARLLGAADGLRKRESLPVWPAERFEVMRYSAAACAQLPRPIFEQQWEAGQRLSLSEALTYAAVDDLTEGSICVDGCQNPR
jgi:tetratricopeptide (TPR) repeat protein